nr:unnamed protein product [Callosobruchus analis]
MVIAAVTGSLALALTNLNRFMANPTVVTIQKDFRNWMNHLPAVTGCLNEKLSKRKAENYIKRFEDDKTLKNVDMVKLVTEVHPDLSGTLVTFERKRELKWKLILTELGVCITFNSKFANLLEVRKESANDSQPEDNCILKCHYLNRLCYARYDSDPNYPLQANISDEVEINYKMTETDASPDIRYLSPTQRRCRFDDEPLTDNVPYYSTSICYPTRDSCKLKDTLNTFNIDLTVREPTRICNTIKSCIDHIVICTNKFDYCAEVVDSILSDHTAQMLTLRTQIGTEIVTSREYRTVTSENITKLRNHLAVENWNDVYFDDNLNDKFEAFYSTFAFYFETCFPLKKSWNINRKKSLITRDGKTCDIKGLLCLSRHADLITQPPFKVGCKCPQPCNLITYLPQIPKYTRWDEGGFLDQRITFRWGLIHPTTKYRRDILFGFGDLVVSLGGTFNLFLGISFISLYETAYLIVEGIYKTKNSKQISKVIKVTPIEGIKD